MSFFIPCQVSSLTSKEESSHGAAGLPPLQNPSGGVIPPAPKSPSAFVSPSQRIKEKSRSKTSPSTRNQPHTSPGKTTAADAEA